MAQPRNYSRIYIIGALVLVVALVLILYFQMRKPKSTVVTSIPSNGWKQDVETAYNKASNAKPKIAMEQIASDMQTPMKMIYIDGYKISQSTNSQLSYAVNSIVVQGDVDTIKKELEAVGYGAASVSSDYKTMTIKNKLGDEFEFLFSVGDFGKGTIDINKK